MSEWRDLWDTPLTDEEIAEVERGDYSSDKWLGATSFDVERRLLATIRADRRWVEMFHIATKAFARPERALLSAPGRAEGGG